MRSARTGKYPASGRHCNGGGAREARAGLRLAHAPAPVAPAGDELARLTEYLLRRVRFTPAPGHNVIAAAWPMFYARLQLPPQAAEGLTRQWWTGPALLQTLFALEHEAVGNRLADAHPHWSDARVQAGARAVTAAVLYRIHVHEWCRALVPLSPWRLALYRHRARAWGGGAVSTLAPSLAPLLPDRFHVHSALTGNVAGPTGGFGFLALHGNRAGPLIEGYGAANLWYSLGVSAAGAFILRNHPLSDRRLPGNDGCFGLPLAAAMARQRTSGCATFNDLRRRVGLPPARDWSAFAPRWTRRLAGAYTNADAVDALPGLLAERRAPGWAVGETALRCLLACAGTPPRLPRGSRRWVLSSSLRSVLLRHYPVLQDALYRVDNPFCLWRRVNLIVAA